MTLKAKLSALDRFLPKAEPTPGKNPEIDPSDTLPGSVCENALGCFWEYRMEMPLDHCHGGLTLGDFLKNHSGHLPLVARNRHLNPVNLERLIFLDTETTGLSGGIGTIAFMVGVGYFADGRFVIRQFFLRTFEEEKALLSEVFELVRGLKSAQGALVSFNGKAFDLPLLLNRGVYHRLHQGLPAFDHIDILHPARRLWKNHLPDCSLGTLETRILKIHRTGDIPGYLIPELYFRFLRSGDPRPLRPVFDHNRMDILTMVSLLHLFLGLYKEKPMPPPFPLDWVAVGNAFEAVRAYAGGQQFYEQLLADQAGQEKKKEALLSLARIYKKSGNYGAAIRVWEQALQCPGFTVAPYEELAKAYEHHLADLRKAEEYTVRALNNLEMLERLRGAGFGEDEKQRLQNRLKRLNQRLQRSG